MSRRRLIVVAVWFVALAALFGQLVAYSAEPGSKGRPPVQWDDALPLERDPEHWTVLIFAHPRCPCTRATLAEFARLHGVYHDRISATLVLYHPVDQPADWTDGALRRAAERIDGLRLVMDPGGKITERFGVQTSGHVLAYAPDGGLGYCGGLTTSRGHEGVSHGVVQLRKCFDKGSSQPLARYPVFGCPILEQERAPCDDGECNKP